MRATCNYMRPKGASRQQRRSIFANLASISMHLRSEMCVREWCACLCQPVGLTMANRFVPVRMGAQQCRAVRGQAGIARGSYNPADIRCSRMCTQRRCRGIVWLVYYGKMAIAAGNAAHVRLPEITPYISGETE